MLIVRYLPLTAHSGDIESLVDQQQHRRLTDRITSKAIRTCHGCQQKINGPLHLHASWDYEGHVQMLRAVNPLCQLCHILCHPHLTATPGQSRAALDHLCAAHRLSPLQGISTMNRWKRMWGARNLVTFTVSDVRWLTQFVPKAKITQGNFTMGDLADWNALESTH